MRVAPDLSLYTAEWIYSLLDSLTLEVHGMLDFDTKNRSLTLYPPSKNISSNSNQWSVTCSVTFRRTWPNCTHLFMVLRAKSSIGNTRSQQYRSYFHVSSPLRVQMLFLFSASFTPNTLTDDGAVSTSHIGIVPGVRGAELGLVVAASKFETSLIDEDAQVSGNNDIMRYPLNMTSISRVIIACRDQTIFLAIKKINSSMYVVECKFCD